jgi:thymidylate kinase
VLLSRVRGSYLRQAAEQGWIVIDADRDREAVAADVAAAVDARTAH